MLPRRKRGSNDFGKGVIRVPQRGGKPDRYGARAGPAQRSVGTFDTPEEAEAVAAEAEAKIAAGISPWDGKQRTNKHKRGEVCQACRVKPRDHRPMHVCAVGLSPLLCS